MTKRVLIICAVIAMPSLAEVTVTHPSGKWILQGTKNRVEINESDLSVNVHAGATIWKMVASAKDDMLVRSGRNEFRLRLADAGNIKITPYETGFKTGVKIVLDRFRSPRTPLDLRLVLTMCLEGAEEELVSEATVIEHGVSVRELNWPKELDGREIDYTVIPSDDGTLLPRDWPKPYHPIHRRKGDNSMIQSHLIETWAMSWWGFQKGDAALIVIVETPDDAAYTFSHPAGGPTKMGPSWLAQLDRFGYLRSVRMSFLGKGNYVDLCKRYRRHVMDSGLFVSLNDKIAHDPKVRNLIGTPVMGARVLRNLKPGSAQYDPKKPENNYRLTTFAQNIEQLRDLKARGFERLNVSLSGWLNLGYDRQTPDALPPAKEAGGWEGMKAFFDACKELGYTCWIHDQYRDYYLDAPSWNPDFAVHEEDATRPPSAFPGTRFKHDWKDGSIPLMDNWDGGAQGYLNNRFMLGHVIKNFRAMFEHGIHPDGSYQDVFGYIPPDQDFNPEHPNTRTDSMNYRAGVLRWIKNNVGIVGTEDGSDWVIPYVDYLTSRMNRQAANGNDPEHEDAIQVPLYELVYHDAVVTTYSANSPRGFLHASAPEWYILRTGAPREVNTDQIRRMTALHKRVALLEMTGHEFLDKDRRRERTTFADGTTVTVDWQTNTTEIKPELPSTATAPIVPRRTGKTEKIVLFDGETLDRWDGNPAWWSLRDGAIAAKVADKVPTTFIFTKNSYSDFRLTLWSKMVESENHAGMCLWGERVEQGANKWAYKGPLVIFPNPSMWDYITNQSIRIDKTTTEKVTRQNEWIQVEILAQGNRIRAAYNGVQVFEWREPNPERLREGPIGLQLHGFSKPQEVQYKDVVIETFPAEDRLVTIKR